MLCKQIPVCVLSVVAGLIAWAPILVSAEPAEKPLCLYVSSYHPGYAWSDSLEKGLRDSLDSSCEITEFYMDTKRNKSTAHKRAAGHAAYEVVKELQPDIVITSDDNAAKYLIVPYLMEGEIPVVFSGINWTVSEYGFPVSNVTGIVEVAPVKTMLLEGIKARKLQSGHGLSVAYLGSMTLTETKNFERVSNLGSSLGMTIDSILTNDFDTWKHGFTLAQDYDMVIVGNNAGIADFDSDEAIAWVHAHTQKLSMTNHPWMMPYTSIGYTKIGEEHGQWAAATAVAILGGVKAIDIPLVTNRRWDTWVNAKLLSKTNSEIENSVLKIAKQVQ